LCTAKGSGNLRHFCGGRTGLKNGGALAWVFFEKVRKPAVADGWALPSPFLYLAAIFHPLRSPMNPTIKQKH